MKRDYSVLTWSDKGEQGAQWTHGTQTHQPLHFEAFHPTAKPAKKGHEIHEETKLSRLIIGFYSNGGVFATSLQET
jgi:hypothetical protein